MIPIDLTKLIPKLLQENPTAGGNALLSKLNKYFGDNSDIDSIQGGMKSWKTEIINMNYFKVPYRTPSNLIEELAEMVSADYQVDMTERQKRQRITDAVRTHKYRTTWVNDAKIVIDTITGESSSIYNITWSDEFVLVGDEAEVPTGLYWSALGYDGVDDELGIYLDGIDLNPSTAGVVFIDLGYSQDEVYEIEDDDSIICGDGVVDALYYSSIGADGVDTELGMYIPDVIIGISDIIDKIVIELQDHIPAYYKVYLGFINNAGIFQILTEA